MYELIGRSLYSGKIETIACVNTIEEAREVHAREQKDYKYVILKDLNIVLHLLGLNKVTGKVDSLGFATSAREARAIQDKEKDKYCRMTAKRCGSVKLAKL